MYACMVNGQVNKKKKKCSINSKTKRGRGRYHYGPVHVVNVHAIL